MSKRLATVLITLSPDGTGLQAVAADYYTLNEAGVPVAMDPARQALTDPAEIAAVFGEIAATAVADHLRLAAERDAALALVAKGRLCPPALSDATASGL